MVSAPRQNPASADHRRDYGVEGFRIHWGAGLDRFQDRFDIQARAAGEVTRERLMRDDPRCCESFSG